MIYLLIAFQLKHFICDFPLQYPFHYLNKGKYGHIGGIWHAAIHGFGTLFALLLCGVTGWFPIIATIADFILHYHIDWAKMNINKYFKLKPDNSEYFWHLLGFDQLLHQLTYIGIMAYAASLGII